MYFIIRRLTVKIQKLWPGIIPAVVLILIFGIALWLRVGLPYNNVFTSNGIVFTGNDAYYHMRLVQLLVNNFPHFPQIDPALIFSGAPAQVISSFFQWLLGTVVWIIGLGSPSQHTLDVIGVYYPAILGALTVIPTYFIGKTLWGRHGNLAGLIAAGLVAMLPGEFLGRSILGFTDQHVAETLLSVTAILFMILAIKSARTVGLSFNHLKSFDWKIIRRPGIYSILGGIFLGLYIFAWQGALLLIFPVALYLIIQFIIDHLRRRSSEYLTIVGGIVFLISLIFIPVSAYRVYPYIPSLLIGLLIPLVLGIGSKVMASRGLPRGFYPLAIVIIGLAGLGIIYLISPSTVKSMLNAFSIFTPSETLLATIEAQSIFTPLITTGNFIEKFTSTPAWINFYFSLPLALIGMAVIIIANIFRQGNPEKGLFIMWSLVMFAATLGQRRFAYYLIVNMALLASFSAIIVYYLIRWFMARSGGDKTKALTSSVLDLNGLEVKPVVESAKISRDTKKMRRRERQEARKRELERRRRMHEDTRSVLLIRDYVSTGLAAIIIFMLLFSQAVIFPADSRLFSISQTDPWYKKTPTGITAKSTPYAPGATWVKALAWVSDNTSQPFESPVDFYQVQKPGYTYPSSAYGVMAWWDYGYWITYMGHRIPNANPGQDPSAVKKVAAFFTAQDEDSADLIAQEVGSGYVIMDFQTATSKFWAVATWVGKDPSEFFEIYYTQQGEQKLYIYPEYYRAFSTRLYSFDGQAVVEQKPLVISYIEQKDRNGTPFRIVLSETEFATYQEAQAHIASQTEGNYVIVGNDVLISPVPLEALKHYRPVYNSEDMIAVSSTNQTAAIKIFERID
jgi:oligosaccharyl transferase (archaeosortase A-associated)